MRILDTRIFRGPNLYARFPVIRLTADLGELEHWPSAKLEGFNDALLRHVPSLDSHTCSYGVAGGFVRRLREGEGTWMGHVLEHVAIELQVLAGARVSYGKTRGAGQPGHYDIVYQFEEETVGELAGELALRLLQHLIPRSVWPEAPEAFEFNTELEELIQLAQRRQFGPSTGSLVRAAEARGIPWLRLNDDSLVQFGHGRYQKRIQATVTSDTRHISVEIASDKELTNRILRDLGLPVPQQALSGDPERLAAHADRMGYPVVVKPYDANHGRGVSLNLPDAAAVRLAFEKAREHSAYAVVERYIPGFDHRMLVVNGELIAVAKRVPGHVVGDGERTIRQLIDLVNEDPRRGIGHEKVLTRIELDYQAERLLGQAGLTADSILPAGQVFYLRSTGNLSTGGTAVDMTDVVHPDNREMAVRAAEAVGLDVAGIDFISPDVARSYREIGGAICEINAAPGFRMHVAPTEGRSRDVAGPVLDMLFPPGTPSRIPIGAITGTNGKTTTARMLAHIHKLSGRCVGLSTTDGVYIDGERTVVGDMTGPVAAQMVLRDTSVDLAVLETARGGLVRAGLGYPKVDVGAVLNVASDHLGMRGIDTLEDLALVKRIVVEVAERCAVLNADDELCLRMADYTDAERIAYVTMDPRHVLVAQHIRAGGLAAVLEEGMNGQMITLYDRGSHLPLSWTHLIPATLEGKALHNVQNAMFAAVMAYAMGVSFENIRQGLRTFDSTYFQAPGRLNVFKELPFRVILDYGHNAAAVTAMASLAGKFDVTGRRICVLAAPGDRRDVDIAAIAAAAAGAFDHYIIRCDDDPRGRAPDEVPRLLVAGLLAAGVPADAIQTIIPEPEAVSAALAAAKAGDLVVIFGDHISRCWKQIIYFKDGAPRPVDEPAPPPAVSGVAPAMLDAQSERAPGSSRPRRGVIEDARGVRLARERED